MTELPPKYGFVIDNRKCIGCHACSTACKSENEVPLGVHRTWVRTAEVGTYPDVTRRFQVTRCNHCETSPCATICPTSAMHKRDDGIVDFDKDACIGCKACMQACPYDAIYIDPETTTAAKCNYCAHRTEIGLEPACVVVCPEHAILAGDMNDPTSEIAMVISEQAGNLSVRRPEKGTSPQLFYIDGHEVNLRPDADQAPSVPYAVDRPYKPEWHWPVPAYMVTKAVASGTVVAGAIGSIWFVPPLFGIAAAFVALVALLATTGLLVADLEKPGRFLLILKRPNWDSWLARGAIVLTALGAVLTAWLGLEVDRLLMSVGSSNGLPNGLYLSVLGVGFPVGVMGAVYTAFLFGQAKGRDAWLSPWMPMHLALQSLMAGGATMLLLNAMISLPRATTEGFTVLFAVGLLGDLVLRAMDHEVRLSRYASMYWASIGVGIVAPFVLLVAQSSVGNALAAMAALLGLYLFEHAFVMAPQEIRNA